jgi:hypothetical protein
MMDVQSKKERNMKLIMISTTNMATRSIKKTLFVLGVAATLFGMVRIINIVLRSKEDLAFCVGILMFIDWIYHIGLYVRVHLCPIDRPLLKSKNLWFAGVCLLWKLERRSDVSVVFLFAYRWCSRPRIYHVRSCVIVVHLLPIRAFITEVKPSIVG